MRRSIYVPDLEELTEIQQRFCDEYLIDLDPVKAAIRAGYPPENARRAARAIMQHKPAQDRIERSMAVRSARTGINQDRVLHALGAMLLSDPGSLFREDGSMRPLHELTPEERAMIAGVKVRRGLGFNPEGGKQPEEVVEIKLVPRDQILQLAMRHLGMLNDKVTVEHTSVAARLREAQARRAGVLEDGRVIDGEILNDGPVEPDLAMLEGPSRLPMLDEGAQALLDEILGE